MLAPHPIRFHLRSFRDLFVGGLISANLRNLRPMKFG
jgi:hypothetical protein